MLSYGFTTRTRKHLSSCVQGGESLENNIRLRGGWSLFLHVAIPTCRHSYHSRNGGPSYQGSPFLLCSSIVGMETPTSRVRHSYNIDLQLFICSEVECSVQQEWISSREWSTPGQQRCWLWQRLSGIAYREIAAHSELNCNALFAGVQRVSAYAFFRDKCSLLNSCTALKQYVASFIRCRCSANMCVNI